MSFDKLNRLHKVLLMVAFLVLFPNFARAVPTEDGFEIPRYGPGIEITDVYRGPKGQIVLGFYYKSRDGGRYDFYDTVSQKRLAPDQERQLASEKGFLTSYVTKNGLVAAFPHSSVNKRDGTWAVYPLDGSICTWPYSSSISLENQHFMTSWMIFVELKVAEHKAYQRSCENINQAVRLKTNYRDQSPAIYALDDDGVYLALRDLPYLIHVHNDGRTRFFKGRDDVALVATDKIKPIIVDAGSSGPSLQQGFVNEIERLIAAATRAQMENNQ